MYDYLDNKGIKDTEKLLHTIVRKEDFKYGRQDVVDDSNFLQVGIMMEDRWKSYKPHKHIYKERTQNEDSSLQ